MAILTKQVAFFAILWATTSCLAQTKLPDDHLLWPQDHQSVIHYDQETIRTPDAAKHSLSQSNRVYTDVSQPTYAVHRPDPEKSNGIGLVICPGGGYTDVWLDREGHDLAIWLKDYGITSLVLKYRTNGKGDIDKRKYAWDTYMPAVVADAEQAVRTLRSQSTELKLNPNRIGICGFSAGGNLALQVAVFKTIRTADRTADQANEVSSKVNFAGLFYPWFRTDEYKTVLLDDLPPIFMMNAADDRLTPASRCVEFYGRLLQAKAKPELHIMLRGGHGFDLGDGKGASTRLWKDSFVAWLQDAGFTE